MNSVVKTKIKKAVKITASALWWCALILLFILLINIIGSKLSGKVPKVFGYSVMHIVSPSMEDEIMQGSYILIKEISPEDVEINDVICFYSDDPTIYGIPNTHRVVSEPVETASGIEFVTKGDANALNDPVNARGERLIGVYVKTLHGVTGIVRAMNGNTPAFIFIGLTMATVGMSIYSLVLLKKHKEDEK